MASKRLSATPVRGPIVPSLSRSLAEARFDLVEEVLQPFDLFHLFHLKDGVRQALGADGVHQAISAPPNLADSGTVPIGKIDTRVSPYPNPHCLV